MQVWKRGATLLHINRQSQPVRSATSTNLRAGSLLSPGTTVLAQYIPKSNIGFAEDTQDYDHIASGGRRTTPSEGMSVPYQLDWN